MTHTGDVAMGMVRIMDTLVITASITIRIMDMEITVIMVTDTIRTDIMIINAVILDIMMRIMIPTMEITGIIQNDTPITMIMRPRTTHSLVLGIQSTDMCSV